jgi:hypothetical protein
MALFFARLLPQFQPVAGASFLSMFLLGTLFAASHSSGSDFTRS